MTDYDGVIFDFDGVLLDADKNSFKWANEARLDKARDLGYDHDLEVLRALFEAEKSADRMEEFLDRHGIDVEDLREWERHVEKEKIRLVKKGSIGLYPEAGKVLERIDVPKAVVSNAYSRATHEIVEYLGLDSELEFWRAPSLEDIGEYVDNMKPSPDMLLEAMEEIGASNPVMVGDSSSDVRSARNAGIDSVYINRQGEENGEATYNISSLDELFEIIG